jgi:hypothetical protein
VEIMKFEIEKKKKVVVEIDGEIWEYTFYSITPQI